MARGSPTPFVSQTRKLRLSRGKKLEPRPLRCGSVLHLQRQAFRCSEGARVAGRPPPALAALAAPILIVGEPDAPG